MENLAQFLKHHATQHHLPTDLTETVATISAACTEISAQVRLGALSGVLGAAGTGNIPVSYTHLTLPTIYSV